MNAEKKTLNEYQYTRPMTTQYFIDRFKLSLNGTKHTQSHTYTHIPIHTK